MLKHQAVRVITCPTKKYIVIHPARCVPLFASARAHAWSIALLAPQDTHEKLSGMVVLCCVVRPWSLVQTESVKCGLGLLTWQVEQGSRAGAAAAGVRHGGGGVHGL
jgi:hypothetical protein